MEAHGFAQTPVRDRSTGYSWSAARAPLTTFHPSPAEITGGRLVLSISLRATVIGMAPVWLHDLFAFGLHGSA